MDLHFKLVSRIGSYTKLPNGIRRDETGCFDFKEFASFSQPNSQPLDRSKLACVYMYVVPFKSDRAVVFINDKTFKVVIFLLYSRTISDFPVLKKSILNSLARSGRKEEYSVFEMQSALDNRSTKNSQNTLTDAFVAISEGMNRHFVLCVSGSHLVKDFIDKVQDIHPVVNLSSLDYKDFASSASSLDWHVKAIEYIGTIILDAESSLDERLHISRTLNIPIGSLPPQWETYATDVMFSRLLTKANMIHWWSNGPNPDIGMGDVGNDALLNLVENQLSQEEKQKMTFYSNYCIEIGLRNFDIASILKYEDIVKSDKDLAMMIEVGNDAKGEASFTKQGFQSIVELLTLILKVKIEHDEQMYQNLLDGFISWISNPRSCYYDPVIVATLNKLLVQTTRRLANDLKDRSINVVWLSPSKLIIDSNKKTIRPAREYFNYVLNILGALDVMVNVGIAEEDVKFWRVLIFQSAQKYVGKLEDEETFEMQWRESEYLPQYLKSSAFFIVTSYLCEFMNAFNQMIAEAIESIGEMTEVEMLSYYPRFEAQMCNIFIEQTVTAVLQATEEGKERMRKYEADKAITAAQEGKKSSSAKVPGLDIEYQADADGEEEEEDDDYDSADSFIVDEEDDQFRVEEKPNKKQKLKELRRKQKALEEVTDECEPPNAPGNKFRDDPPITLFVDVVLEFFSSFEFLQELYPRLAENLNDMIDRGRVCLSPAATVQKKIRDYVLGVNIKAISCDSCQIVTSLDVFRSYDYSRKAILCPNCQEPMLVPNIESKIIAWVNQMTAYFAVQDLHCSTTFTARSDSLQILSERGSRFEEKKYAFRRELEHSIQTKFRDLSVLAQQTGMKNLQYLLSQYCSI